jgi:Ca2+-binding RTX toxin-like protein
MPDMVEINFNVTSFTFKLSKLAQNNGLTISDATDCIPNKRLFGQEVTNTFAVTLCAAHSLMSNCRILHDTDNTFYWALGGMISWVNWTPTQIKVNYPNQRYLIGTDGNDSFDANYYNYVGSPINTTLLTNFLAGGGDDVFGGSTRADTLWGGTGNDTAYGYAGDDKLYGEEGNDTLVGQDGNDYMDGGVGNDLLYGGLGNDVGNGGDGNDLVSGNEGDDVLYGGAGLDTLYGGIGNDYLDGGADNDILMGEAGNDTLFGGLGADELQGGDGNDQLLGEDGNDTLFGQTGDDTLLGGAGDDLLMGFTGKRHAANDSNCFYEKRIA